MRYGRGRRLGQLIAGGCLVVSVVAASAQPLGLDEVLFRANQYVVTYEKQFASVIAEERYVQRVVDNEGRVKRTRELRSEFLFLRAPGSEIWSELRDVFEVDGRAVRDREARMQKLFRNGWERSSRLVRQIIAESARHNIGDVTRNFNLPTLAINFLHPLHQHRFNFEKIGEETIDGTLTWEVRYSEHRRPTFIRSIGADLFARGRLWIDPAEGRLLRSELIVGDLNTQVRGQVTVTYRHHAGIGAFVPVEMVETYDRPRRPSADRIEGTATYSNYRRFDVETSWRVR